MQRILLTKQQIFFLLGTAGMLERDYHSGFHQEIHTKCLKTLLMTNDQGEIITKLVNKCLWTYWLIDFQNWGQINQSIGTQLI